MREWLDELARRGELRVVPREVDPCHELAAVTKASQARDDSAVLFERVAGTDFAVATNLYASRRRLEHLIGAEPGAFCPRWNALLDAASGPGRAAPTTPVARPADLVEGAIADLPHLTWHGRDAGPYITAGIYLGRDPDSGVANLSFHRSMHVDDRELRVRLGTSHHLARYQQRAEAAGEALEAAVLIGPQPSVFLAACAGIPEDWDELALAGAIEGAPIETYPGLTVDLPIPAATSIVIEGRFLPNELRPEGPFGEFLGYYVPEGDNHVFEVTAVYWRPGAVYHGLRCGSPEDISALEAVLSAKVYRHLAAVLPGIVDVSCAPTVMNTTVKIRPRHEGHARQVIMAAFGADLDYNNLVIVVDEDVDITDMNEIMWAFITRGRGDRRVMVLEDVPGFYRDPHRDYWGRVGIDATRPWGREAEFECKRVPGEDAIDLDAYTRG